MPDTSRPIILVISVFTGCACVALVFLLSLVGGLLNRGRGGYIHFGPANSSSPEGQVWYWPAHILSRLLFAVPTGIAVLVAGLHLRASVVVTLMTWLSLYVGWGSYMMIGTNPSNYDSRTGVFDWLIGRQERNWTFSQRFMREYPAMSLRGLVWTAPQGYILQQFGFGWEYSLSGSLMGLFYYLGARTPMVNDSNFIKAFDSGIAYSEFYWGWWIWFVIIISSLSQLVRKIHVWIYKKNQYLGFKPESFWEKVKYVTLNRPAIRAAYELFMLILNVVLCCSVVFYQLVVQDDIRNKGQTFVGLFTAVICLTFAKGWVWGSLYRDWQQQRLLKKQKSSMRQYRLRYSGRHSPSIGDLDQLENGPTVNVETQPLLSWPFSHPDRAVHERQLTRTLPDRPADPSQSDQYGSLLHHATIEPATSSTAFLILWPSVEKWLWVDIFVWVRRVIGVVSLLGTVLAVVLVVIATVWDRDSPRFLKY